MTKPQQREPGDPNASYWIYADIAHRAGLSERTARERMREWERANFPCPLPHSRRELRWHPPAVLRWFDYMEAAARAAPPAPPLSVIQGGRG